MVSLVKPNEVDFWVQVLFVRYLIAIFAIDIPQTCCVTCFGIHCKDKVLPVITKVKTGIYFII